MRMAPQPAVDSDIPLPEPVRSKYPWKQMKVGDSFFVAGMTSGRLGARARAYSARNKEDFVARNVIENGVEGCRVWRVA